MAEGTNIAKAYVQIVPTTKGIKSQLTSELSGGMDSAGNAAGVSFGKAFMSKIAALGIGAGITKLIKDTISEGAALEQSIGGIETLFGTQGAQSVEEYASIVGKTVDEVQADYDRLSASQATMMQYASEAWRTAGVSQNEYMEQVTSFSASLLQATNGDTQQAADTANQALIDMADNANKFGTDITSIQNAYQGLARQNYTMLDNLKLGYGGTKTEMERLLADAQELSGIEYDINNLNDVYQAIHVIQEEMGVTGTTAKEAVTTMSGSMGMMRSAWKNLMANLAIGEDVNDELSAVLQSVGVFGKNLISMLGNVLKGVPSVLSGLTDNILSALSGVAGSIRESVANFINQAGPMLVSFSGSLREKAGQLVSVGLDILGNLVKGIMDAMPTLIQSIPTIVSNIARIINDNMPKILAKGWDILKTIVKGIIDTIPVIWSELPAIGRAIIDVISAVNWLNLGKSIIEGIMNGAVALVGLVKSTASNLGNNIINAFKSMNWLEVGKNVVQGIINGLKSMLNSLWEAGKNLASNLMSSVTSKLGIHSPSKEFEWMGLMVGEGFAQGITGSSKIVADAMDNITESATGTIYTDVATNGQVGRYGYELGSMAQSNATINVYASEGMDVNAVAEAVSRKLNRQVANRKAVFA